jgi:hypothetical protein
LATAISSTVTENGFMREKTLEEVRAAGARRLMDTDQSIGEISLTLVEMEG